MKYALLVTAVVAAAVGFSFRQSIAGTPSVLVGLGVAYVALTALALYKLYDDGTLLDVFRIRAGDFTIGIVTAGVLVGGAWLARHWLEGAPAQLVWLYRVALQLGPASSSPLALAAIAVIAAMEEVVWRGLVLTDLAERFGTRRGWPLAALLYGLAHAPTLLTLSDPDGSTNPILVFAAFGAGLVWSFMASLLGRLPPVMISHAAFTYFVVSSLLPRFG